MKKGPKLFGLDPLRSADLTILVRHYSFSGSNEAAAPMASLLSYKQLCCRLAKVSDQRFNMMIANQLRVCLMGLREMNQ